MINGAEPLLVGGAEITGDMITQSADAPEVREQVRRFRDYEARSERLLNMRAELIRKYPDQWVALTEGGTLVAAESVAEMVAQIKQLGERPGYAAAEFLNTRPRRWIL